MPVGLAAELSGREEAGSVLPWMRACILGSSSEAPTPPTTAQKMMTGLRLGWTGGPFYSDSETCSACGPHGASVEALHATAECSRRGSGVRSPVC